MIITKRYILIISIFLYSTHINMKKISLLIIILVAGLLASHSIYARTIIGSKRTSIVF